LTIYELGGCGLAVANVSGRVPLQELIENEQVFLNNILGIMIFV
jgi:hypothetical protein